jgi:hypothetical protein
MLLSSYIPLLLLVFFGLSFSLIIVSICTTSEIMDVDWTLATEEVFELSVFQVVTELLLVNVMNELCDELSSLNILLPLLYAV